jgi:hypothetical protein
MHFPNRIVPEVGSKIAVALGPQQGICNAAEQVSKAIIHVDSS